MNDRKIENATIESTMLGIEDHGVMILFVQCAGEGWGQGFGGYILDQAANPGTYDGKRTASGFGIVLIREILEVVGVDNWEDLKGKNVRADHSHDKVHRLGHITKNKWVDIQAVADRFK